MNSQIKQKWIDALTSGEYQQDKLYLKTKRGYCCLGVLTDLYHKEKGFKWYENEIGTYYTPSGADQFLPKEVQDWAEIDRTPSVMYCNSFYSENSEYSPSKNQLVELSYLNDNGISFNEIAELIEEQL